MKHHPSCKVTDLELDYYCNQCGDREWAAEIEVLESIAALRAEVEGLKGKLKVAEEALVYYEFGMDNARAVDALAAIRGEGEEKEG